MRIKNYYVDIVLYLGAFVSSTIAAVSASIKTLGLTMAGMVPKFIYCII